MKKIFAITLMIIMLGLVACSSHTHIIGDGAQGTEQVKERQWYILWGLVPINDVDSKAMAAGATDYTIETEACAVDIIIGMFTSIVTVNSRTVTVTK